MSRKRVLSGIQPSGSLHIGNYFGMMKRMIQYQEDSELFCFLVNYHALTTLKDGNLLRSNTLAAACDFLALGLDPKKSVFWVQSDVPEVTELYWVLANFTHMGLLERAHAYKDKLSKGLVPNCGLFSYPVLMAADILLFGVDLVPVGKDQKQHVEITRDIAGTFNKYFGDVFVLPEPVVEESTGIVLGTDGRKMSKSYGNTIEIFADRDSLAKMVMQVVTDNIPVDEPKDPDNSALYSIYSMFLDKQGREDLRQRFLTPGLKYGVVKAELIDVIWEYFAPFREARSEIGSDLGYVIKVLKQGSERAREVGSTYINNVRRLVGLNYRDFI